ncbi:MAG: peptidoglycan DD-metalloendopeptidase family protein [Clostridium sp.]|nr:peptidoglycan DD-metalloendopeptidase family protein [Clostridium sp.]
MPEEDIVLQDEAETDELALVRERRRQREEYEAEYGNEKGTENWFSSLIIKQLCAVAVLLGLFFGLRLLAPKPFEELRQAYRSVMGESMEWAEIWAQIVMAAQNVAAPVKEEPEESSSLKDEKKETTTEPTDNSESASSAPRSTAQASAVGGASLPKNESLAFSPLWVSVRAASPVDGSVSSGFGLRVNPVTGELGWHAGIDIAAKEGSEIFALYPGRVKSVSYDSVSGNYILLDHGGGLISSYCHASKILVEEGQRVASGQKIALVGQTGQATGPHLHLELRLNGLCYNPLPLLRYGE